MAALTKSVAIARKSWGGDVIGRFDATGVFYAGSLVVEDGSAATGVKKATGTSGFKGISLGEAAVGDVVDVLELGYIRTSINSSVSAGDEGTTVYADVANTSDNPTDITKTSTSNLPVGKISSVEVAGAAGVNRVVIRIAGDGHRSI